MSNTSETLEYRASEQVRDRLTAMMLDLLANGAILDELLNCYRMFHFTGGDVPRPRWRLVAIASYLEDPFASDRIGTSEAQRYRDLAEEITALGQTVAAGRPRTLRARQDIVNTFAEASGEIRALEIALEADLAALLEELGDASFSERMHAFGSGEQDSTHAEAVRLKGEA